MKEQIERLEAGIASYRQMKRRRLNRMATSSRGGGGGSDSTNNLAGDVPKDAWDLWDKDREENPRKESYRKKLADDLNLDVDKVEKIDATSDSRPLRKIIKSAIEQNAVVDLGSGTYEMEKMLDISSGDLFAVVGDGSADATIRWNGPLSEKEYPNYNESRNYPSLLFSTSGGTIQKGYFYGVTVDIEGESEPGLNRDAGIMRAKITDELWVDDVVLKGKRHQYQYIDGELKSVGYGPVFQPGAVNKEATIFFNDVQMTDGQKYVDIDRYNHFGQGSAVTLTKPHRGKVIFKDVKIHDWSSCAFYLSNRDDRKSSRNVLWNCEVANCSAGHVRIGFNATIVGGKIVRDDPDPDLPGTPLSIQEGRDIKVIGLRIEASTYNRAIELRNAASDVTFDRLILRVSGPNQPVYFRPKYDPELDEDEDGHSIKTDLNVSLDNCYLYDEYSESRTYGTVSIDNGNEDHQTVVEAIGDTRIKSEGGAEIVTESQYGSTSRGWFKFEGTKHPPGGEYTRREVGMADLSPEDLPSYEFDYSVRE